MNVSFRFVPGRVPHYVQLVQAKATCHSLPNLPMPWHHVLGRLVGKGRRSHLSVSAVDWGHDKMVSGTSFPLSPQRQRLRGSLVATC